MYLLVSGSHTSTFLETQTLEVTKMKDNKDTDIIFKQTMFTVKEEEQESSTPPPSKEKMTKEKKKWPLILKTLCVADLRVLGFYYKGLLYITGCRAIWCWWDFGGKTHLFTLVRKAVRNLAVLASPSPRFLIRFHSSLSFTLSAWYYRLKHLVLNGPTSCLAFCEVVVIHETQKNVSSFNLRQL